ncbi:hypothetical protein Pmani_012458 [Petrolisthes manimaculis]|uniref:THAP-type domain-containing protein n=1 Tax=Petrolisthes manimaculis TaxID=1843537 RepID=A0AAE1PZ90_9EUCA|nr:hypothetical protein Pmani_012458 [Petrolisthes manimaculis]
MRAIRRDNFTPTSNHRVCHQHFQLEDIEWETSLFNEKTGTTLTAKLKRPRLRKGAIPTKLPNTPSYLSTTATTRESPDVRQKRKKEAEIQATIAKRNEDYMNYQRQNSFTNLDELESKLSFLDSYCLLSMPLLQENQCPKWDEQHQQ